MTALRRTVEGLAVIVFIAVVAAIGVSLLGGCASTATQARRVTVGGSHAEELLECIKKGKAARSRKVDQDCADAVDAKYGIRKEPSR